MSAETISSPVTACSKCGRRSHFAWRFDASGRCTACRAKRPPSLRFGPGELLFCVFAGILILTRKPQSAGTGDTTIFVLNIVLYFVMRPALIFLHELSHAVVAAVLGFRVFRITLGVGAPYFDFRLFGITFQFCKGISAGFTLSATRRPGLFRLRRAIVGLAGALVPLAIFLPLCLKGSSLDISVFSRRLAPLELAAWMTIAWAFSSLVPFRPAILGRTVMNDGMQVWQTLTRPLLEVHPPLDYDMAHLASLSLDQRRDEASAVARQILAADPGNPHALRALAETDLRAAADGFRADHPERAPNAALANDLAWRLFERGEPADLERADRLSAFAAEELRERAEVQGTRGAIAAERGLTEEAYPRLFDAHHFNELPRNRAYNAAGLAWACRQMGRGEESNRWWAEAAPLADGSKILKRYRDRLGN